MLIPLDKIKPSPNPVRTSWDEDKMNELVQSIKEQGLIVPIKVRPDNGGYEIVYGHRRVEATRRGGKYTEIESIVEHIEQDADALIKQLIENIQREDENPVDRAKAIKRVLELKGWKQIDISRNGILNIADTSRLLALLERPKEIQDLVSAPAHDGKVPQGKITTRHVREAKIEKLPVEDESELLKKAARERLTSDNTRRLAKVIKTAKDAAEKKAIFESSYEDILTSPALIKGKAQAKRSAAKREKKKRQEEPREVAKYLDALRAFTAETEEAIAVAKFGKFSPEAARFVKGRHDTLHNLLIQLEQVLEI